jgi:hypothetical protein
MFWFFLAVRDNANYATSTLSHALFNTSTKLSCDDDLRAVAIAGADADGDRRRVCVVGGESDAILVFALRPHSARSMRMFVSS